MLCEAVLVNTDYRSRIKHLMQPFEVVGVRDVTLVRYRLPKFRRKIRQEVTYIVYFLIITNLIFY